MVAAARTLCAVVLVTLLGLAMTITAVPAGAQAAVEDDLAYEVLTELTNEPLVMQIADDGRIIWGQRDGLVWVLSPSGVQTLAGALFPAGNLCAACEPEPDYLLRRPNRLGVGGLEEGGLHGLLLHRDFAENGIIFAFRSIPGTRAEKAPGYFEGEFHLSSFVMDPATNLIDPGSEEVLLTVPAEWDNCCHYGGYLNYLPDGTIVLATGDNVDASASDGYGPRDHRNFHTNAELTSANPADRRGKILRLREDGSVPDGSIEGEVPNPFLDMEGWNPYIEGDPLFDHLVGDRAGTPGDGWIEFDPYVYSLGWKQPWRGVVMPNGDLYYGDVGPDASVDDPERGPAGIEDIHLIPFGGGTHAGWPRCLADNRPYRDVNWETLEVGDWLDCSEDAAIARPIGSAEESEWVTGMDPAAFWYHRTPTDPWPAFGSGSLTSEPIAVYPAETDGPLRLPARYDNRMLMMEWSRNAIYSIGYDPATGQLDLDNDDIWTVGIPPLSVNPDAATPFGVASAQLLGRLQAPVDGAVGPDGAFYFLEYGSFFYAGATGRLSRLRGADAELDAATNYGLPTEAPTSALLGVVPSGTPVPLMAALVLLVALAWGRRRRRALVV